MTPITPPTEAAGLLRRVLALLIDWFASTVVALLAVGVGSYGSGSDALATLIVFVLEVVILTWLTGASFGQRILGLRVVAMDGGRVTFPRVLLRTLLICLVIPALVMDSQGRGLHDRAAGSIVVRR
ncbi:MAG: RDD family protein [Candidatus Nanopelagicales bacterium]|jgi:uncharacterized RDD family membrane protein YckC|nr:RDD family protein [Candidatus Nanopelagicales bacterium]MCF8537411.1 RDD family protein [Candidatus Nanopelagicales bacterium]MCF8542187.1 RDD family protein [Candidatus Nanopelagicales bacterium]MCF8557528.1 RDD family protein [Candidatus Nanopelagicales bacterium]